jgi:PmbA protein
MTEKKDYFSLINYGLRLLDKFNGDVKCGELFLEKSKYVNIEISENSIKNSEIGSDSGISIRVIDNRGSLGFSFTNKLDKNSIEKMVNIAIRMMRTGTEDTDFKSLPPKCDKYPSVKGLFDAELKNMQIEDTIKYVEEMIKVCNEDDEAISQAADFSSSYAKMIILNSNGLEAIEKETECQISSEIIVKDKISKETSSGYEWQSERNLNKINAIDIASTALKNAKGNLNRKKIKNMKVPLILTPWGAVSLILRSITVAINAETFQYKRSFLVGKRGETIGSKLLNIHDNALIDGAAGSASFDGEGFPCKNKKIIENGKFLKSGLLHNTYTAGKEGVESTGNAHRRSYTDVPSISNTNCILIPGNFSKDEIFNDIKKGILLDYTGDSPNISTGDFSGLILHGNLIENGELVHPLNETMVAINLLDLFKNIDAVSKELKTYGSYQAPYVRIKDVQILGGAN